jgi:hypothetical protein
MRARPVSRLEPRILAILTLLFLPAAPAAGQASLTRGPYLQMGTTSDVIVRWRTSVATDSSVRYGDAPGNLTLTVGDPTPTTEHRVTVTGLLADTRYYYAVGSTSQTLAGDDANHFFFTSPLPGTRKPTRIWVLGDSGTKNDNARAVRDSYFSFTGATHTGIWLMLGDNAYSDGTDTEYQAAVFDMYPQMLRKSALWPTLGNHDGHTADSATQTGPYYDIFSLPTGGEAGGVPSGTEAYYSFDYDNIHFICLDSYETDRSPSGAMLTWLQQDLAATIQDWVIAFWHHPPYSKGSHDSDSSSNLVQMRANALPILEAGGVDLVLSGHSHSYERSFLLDGHYGSSSTLTSAMIKDSGDGRLDGTGAYQKPVTGSAPHEGAVYIVAGSSGGTGGGTLNHPAMFISLNVLGSVVLDVNSGADPNQDQLDIKFLDSTGLRRDYLTILKGTAGPPIPPLAPDNLGAAASSTTRIDLTWRDNSTDEDGFQVEGSPDGATAWAHIATVGRSVTSYSNTGLSPSTTYFYRARAFNAAGDSPYSNIASAATPAEPPPGTIQIVEMRVSSSTDDAEQQTSSTNLTSSDLELTVDGSNQTVGIRFENVAIPMGAAIVSAYVQFKVDETASTSTVLTIFGEAADNPSTFTSASGNISSRAKTSTAVSWVPPAWTTVGAAGPGQRTPDLSPVIQEITNRPGWASGSSQVIIITGDGAGKRVAESFNGDPGGAPLLHVEYRTGPPPNQPPTVNAGPDQRVALPPGTASLSGSASDDGRLGTLAFSWTGPPEVSFTDPAALSTTASFSAVGSYTLILSANDGELTTGDTVVVTVAVNQPPTVNAGMDQTITLPSAAALSGTANDDDLPNGTLVTSWSKVSGPGTVTFANASARSTTATFSVAGAYELQLTANDGALSASDLVIITVNSNPAPVMVEVRVALSSDDAEERTATGKTSLTSSDLELTTDGSAVQIVGMRFVGVAIPRAATIVNAYLQFKVDETSSAAASLTVQGQAADNAPTFTTATANISSRTRTLSSAPWTPTAWPTVGVAGPDQRTPNIAPVIQEIVNRPDWASGNSLVILIRGTGKRVAESFNGDKTGAALLHVEYR